jgi:hypothetical protein
MKIAAAATVLSLLASAAAQAQTAGPVDMRASGPIVTSRITGSRTCERQSTGDEIVVCGAAEDEEQFRLPLRDEPFNPRGSVASVSRERNRLLGENGGMLGACSVVGPNGMTGCHNQGVWRKREQTGR